MQLENRVNFDPERNNYGEAKSELYSNDRIFQKLKYVY